MKNDPLKILVSGGAGFVGSHLIQRLLSMGHHIICLDNLFTGHKQNIKPFLENHQFEFIRHDITEPILLEVDQIYNLACPATPPHYQYNAIKTIKTNVMGTLNMLGLAKRVKARILQASTSEIYGDPLIHPQKEDYWGNVNTLGIRSCYDEGKRVAETLMMDYHRSHQLETRIIRIFNTYGPRMDANDGRVVSNFICQALQNKDITIYGNGKQTRSFAYIEDLITGMISLMNSEYHLPVNIGNPNEFTMIQLANLIKKITDSKSKIIHKELPEDDPKRRRPDISLARELLDWQPQVELKEGISKTIDYFKSII